MQFLRFISKISDIQRQTRSVATRHKARHVQFGYHWCSNNHFAFVAAEVICRPGLRHDAQFTVKIANRQCNRTFALFVERYRLCLLRDNIDVIDRWLTTTFQFITIATKTQCCQASLSFNDLTVNIVYVCAIAFLTEERLPRIWRNVISNIQHTAINGRHQYIHLFWHLTIFIAGFDFHS